MLPIIDTPVIMPPVTPIVERTDHTPSAVTYETADSANLQATDTLTTPVNNTEFVYWLLQKRYAETPGSVKKKITVGLTGKSLDAEATESSNLFGAFKRHITNMPTLGTSQKILTVSESGTELTATLQLPYEMTDVEFRGLISETVQSLDSTVTPTFTQRVVIKFAAPEAGVGELKNYTITYDRNNPGGAWTIAYGYIQFSQEYPPTELFNTALKTNDSNISIQSDKANEPAFVNGVAKVLSKSGTLEAVSAFCGDCLVLEAQKR